MLCLCNLDCLLYWENFYRVEILIWFCWHVQSYKFKNFQTTPICSNPYELRVNLLCITRKSFWVPPFSYFLLGSTRFPRFSQLLVGCKNTDFRKSLISLKTTGHGLNLHISNFFWNCLMHSFSFGFLWITFILFWNSNLNDVRTP